jgi:hypothetical protein
VSSAKEERLGFFGLALGFTVMFILVLILGVLGILPAFFDAFSLRGFEDDYLMILVFAVIMILFYRMPKRWIFGSSP